MCEFSLIFIFRRAKSYMETEQYDEAVRDYEKVHKGDRGNQEYRYTSSSEAWLGQIPKFKF